jgi:hypothetical protein
MWNKFIVPIVMGQIYRKTVIVRIILNVGEVKVFNGHTVTMRTIRALKNRYPY